MRAGSTRSTVTGTTLSFTHTWLMAIFSPTIAFSAMIGSLFGSDPVARAMVVHANAPQGRTAGGAPDSSSCCEVPPPYQLGAHTDFGWWYAGWRTRGSDSIGPGSARQPPRFVTCPVGHPIGYVHARAHSERGTDRETDLVGGRGSSAAAQDRRAARVRLRRDLFHGVCDRRDPRRPSAASRYRGARVRPAHADRLGRMRAARHRGDEL